MTKRRDLPLNALLILLTVGILGFVTGCATTGNLSEEQLASIKTVRIEDNVKVAENVIYYTAAHAWGGALGGVVGALIAYAGSSNPPDVLKAVMERDGIDLGDIVVNSLHASIDKNGAFFQTTDSEPDAEIELEVLGYGLFAANPFTSKLEPALAV